MYMYVQTVELEKELQRQIAKKLEQRMEKEVLEKVDNAILQPQVDKVLDKSIGKAFQHQVDQSACTHTCSSATACVLVDRQEKVMERQCITSKTG